MKISPEEKIILASVKIHPETNDLEIVNREIPLVSDWDYFVKTITERGIAPLFFIKIPHLSNGNLIPDDVKDKVRKVYFKTMSRGMLLYAHFREIAEAFNKEKIEFIPLKGVYLSEKMYQDIALRQFSDMDLLIRPEKSEQSLSVLKKMGYKASLVAQTEFVQSFSEIVHYPPMVKDEISVEMHIKLHRDNPDYFLDPVKIFEQAQPDTLNNCQVLSMDKYDMLIHLCIHLDKHFVNGSLQFTCYNDIVNYTDKLSEVFNWEEFEERVKIFHATEQVYLHLLLSYKFFHLHLPDKIIRQFDYLLSEKNIKLFINHLRGKSVNQSFVSAHFNHINRAEGLKSKWKYFMDVTFPSKSFIRSKYKLKNNHWIYWYYFTRILTGVKGFIRMLLGLK